MTLAINALAHDFIKRFLQLFGRDIMHNAVTTATVPEPLSYSLTDELSHFWKGAEPQES